MKANYVNAFLNPVPDVWRDKLGVDITYREAEAASGPFAMTDVCWYVAVSGRIRGGVYYELSNKTALELTKLRSPGVDTKELDHRAYAVVIELADEIAKGTASALLRAGYQARLRQPVLFPGGMAVSMTRAQLLAHFDSSFGELSVRLALTEVTEAQMAAGESRRQGGAA